MDSFQSPVLRTKALPQRPELHSERSRGLLQFTEKWGVSFAEKQQEREWSFFYPEGGSISPGGDRSHESWLWDRGCAEEGQQGALGQSRRPDLRTARKRGQHQHPALSEDHLGQHEEKPWHLQAAGPQHYRPQGQPDKAAHLGAGHGLLLPGQGAWGLQPHPKGLQNESIADYPLLRLRAEELLLGRAVPKGPHPAIQRQEDLRKNQQ